VKRYSIILEQAGSAVVVVCHCDANAETVAEAVRAKNPLARVSTRDNQLAQVKALMAQGKSQQEAMSEVALDSALSGVGMDGFKIQK
jgi:K+/H+ antiporter YhaU regulatory subunit KhtT